MWAGFPLYPCLHALGVSLSPLGCQKLAGLLLDGNTEDSSADQRNVRAELGKSAVFVVWGFEASFTTDLLEQGPVRCAPAGQVVCLLTLGLTARLPAGLRRGLHQPPHSIPCFFFEGQSQGIENVAPFWGGFSWLLTSTFSLGRKSLHLAPAPIPTLEIFLRYLWGQLYS